MAQISSEVFEKLKKAKHLPTRQQGDGHENEVEVREDEEQSVKLHEIIDLLVAAGYFRARIKGLSPFDKVVGGMTWCIESCNVDVDVDLLFQENSTIGQKIALTEKIVGVLPKMKCPHRIEPHQIQGLDFIHIFPVIQWLVKRSMEFRQEMSAFVRSYAINQYNKTFGATESNENRSKMLKNVIAVGDLYRPKRYYKRKNALPEDIASRAQITLLEYGHRGGEAASTSIDKDEANIEKPTTTEEQIQQLLSNLTVTKEDVVDELSEEDLKKLERHYASLKLEMKDGGLKSSEEAQILTLEEEKSLLFERIQKLEEEKSALDNYFEESTKLIEEIRLKQKESDKTLKELEKAEASDPEIKEIEELVILNDNLRTQEIQFRDHCKKEMARLKSLIEETKKVKSPVESNGDLTKEYEEEAEKVRLLRVKLAKKNRIVAALQRQLDDVPNRPELAQYQRRFLELYNQVSAKHKETKQYYTLYNTLEDTRQYMKKELSLLNSISENYPEAMQSSSGKEEFLNQFQNIVEGVKQSKLKVEQRLMEEKKKRDELSATLQLLVEQQRKYVAAVRQLSIQCKRYESLLAQT